MKNDEPLKINRMRKEMTGGNIEKNEVFVLRETTKVLLIFP